MLKECRRKTRSIPHPIYSKRNHDIALLKLQIRIPESLPMIPNCTAMYNGSLTIDLQNICAREDKRIYGCDGDSGIPLMFINPSEKNYKSVSTQFYAICSAKLQWREFT